MWVAASQSRPPRQSRDKENLKFQKSQFLCLCPSLSLCLCLCLPLSLSSFLLWFFPTLHHLYCLSLLCHNKHHQQDRLKTWNCLCKLFLLSRRKIHRGGNKNTGQIWIYALGSPQSIFINFIKRTSKLKGLSVRYIMPSKSFKRGKIHSFINSSKNRKEILYKYVMCLCAHVCIYMCVCILIHSFMCLKRWGEDVRSYGSGVISSCNPSHEDTKNHSSSLEK